MQSFYTRIYEIESRILIVHLLHKRSVMVIYLLAITSPYESICEA